MMFHYTPGENTLIKNIYKLPSSSNLLFDLKGNDYQIKKYWDIKDDTIEYDDFDKAKNKIDEILNDSVKIRTEASDVPVGTFLSG
ncbi:MAG: hypothetical protein GXP45_06515 [bacterium]|nr:hypothetical protein [bacterium]